MNTYKPQVKSYEIEQSPLYRLSTRRKLADLLGAELHDISKVDGSGLARQYRIFTDHKTRRFITEPVRDLALIHKRLLKLFKRIAPPDYLHSAVKKRSYKTNAESHVAATNFLKIDIKKFYPAVKFQAVHAFYHQTLMCSPDVATILAKLCTVVTRKHGVHLPTGSCISPILSFLVNQRMFDRIDALCKEHGCTLTVYVDDVTVSGPAATPALLMMIAKEIFHSGYNYHKIEVHEDEPATVTGLVIADGKLHLPHQRAARIRMLGDALECSAGSYRPKLLGSLVGCLSEAEQINAAYRGQRKAVMARYHPEWKQIVADRAERGREKRQRKTVGGAA